MSDNVTAEKRSWIMSQVHGKDTSIEVLVRKYLFNQGFRFRKNDKRYPGKPDIVLPKYRTVIFVHGCFWHRHNGCALTRTPKTNTDFWETKFQRNIANDKKNYDSLKASGWNVVIIWECELTKNRFNDTMEKVVAELNGFLTDSNLVT